MLKPCLKTTLHEEIIIKVIDKITKGEWLEGQKIPGENSLAKEYGVSRNSLREALKALALSNILEIKQGRGTFVTNDALKYLRNSELQSILNEDVTLIELMEARLVIEVEITGLAAKRSTAFDKEQLKLAFEKLKHDTNSKNNPIEAGFQFHTTIAEIAHNKILSRLLTSITRELKEQRNKLLEKDKFEDLLADHEDILEAIINGEVRKARKAMHLHLKHTMNTLFEE